MRKISMPPAVFELATPTIERSQAHGHRDRQFVNSEEEMVKNKTIRDMNGSERDEANYE